MGLLSPWFLAGLAALGLPLWLHMLRQFKRNPQLFSSLMFFEPRVQSSVRHRRLRYLILLAMRLAILLLLALAFANPFINQTSLMAGRRKLTIIAIDRSFSMRTGNRLRDAKAVAHSLVNGLEARGLAQVVAIDSHLETQTGYDTDKGALNAAIESVAASDLASSYGEFARALRVIDQGSADLRLDVHFISDMQQSSMPPSFGDLQLGPHTALQLHAVGEGKVPNWAVENVTTAAHVYDPKQTRLTATLAGWQTEGVMRKVSLLLNNKVLASKDVAVPANGRAQVEFLGFDVPYGTNRGEIRMDPPDYLPTDDSYAFSVERSDPRPVLFLYAGGRSREAFYYKAALESSAATGLTVQAAPMEQASNLDLSKYAYVVLSDVTDFDLGAYVRKGGAALVLLGTDSARLGKVPLTGDSVSSDRVTQGAGYVDDQSVALTGSGKFENVQFFQSLRLTAKPAARVMAKLADGTPLIVEERVGEGRVLVFAGMLDNSDNDFPLHASFLPFVVQSGHYLAGSEERQSSWVAGSGVVLRHARDQTTHEQTGAAQGTAADVVGPDGKHMLSLNDASTALSLQLNGSGFYEVQGADGRRSLVAVHADRRESDLSAVPAETLVLWRNTGNAAAAEQTGRLQRQTVPYGLWRYVLILVLIGALVESLFASRYLKQERQTA